MVNRHLPGDAALLHYAQDRSAGDQSDNGYGIALVFARDVVEAVMEFLAKRVLGRVG